jgi:hypothetical protein
MLALTVTQLASEAVVQETTWTDEELGHTQSWFDHLITHMSTLAGTGKIICTTQREHQLTDHELGRIRLTFQDLSADAKHRNAITGTLSEMAGELAVIAQRSLERIRSDGTAWIRFRMGHRDGLTDFHPLYRSLDVGVRHVEGEITQSTPPVESTSEEGSQPTRIRSQRTRERSRRHGTG